MWYEMSRPVQGLQNIFNCSEYSLKEIVLMNFHGLAGENRNELAIRICKAGNRSFSLHDGQYLKYQVPMYIETVFWTVTFG